jgi:hypothetical protein
VRESEIKRRKTGGFMKLAKVVFRLSLLLGAAALLLAGCGDDNGTEPPCYTITAQTVGTGSVEFSPDSACYHAGTVVTITAVPGESWAFDSWSGDTTSTDNPLIIAVAGNISLVASFDEVYSLNVQIDPSQAGSVILTPDQDYYEAGDVVTVEADPNQFYGFSHWIYESDVVLDNPTTVTFGSADEEIFCQFGVLEGEPDCGDGYVDFYNGGCNSDPEIFQDILPDQIILGTAGTFDAGTRDTDWFQFEVTGDYVLTFTAVGEFDMQIFLIDGTPGCLDLIILQDSAFAANDTGSVSDTVGPGTYWLWAGTALYTGWPCPQDYKAWLTAEPIVLTGTPSPGRPAMKNEVSTHEE